MLSLSRVSKTYNGHRALSEVSFELQRNTVFALVGPNGSGKTTLLKILLGLIVPDESGGVFLGKLGPETAEYRRRVVYMPQNPAFPPHLKVREIIRLVQELRDCEAPHRDQIRVDLEMDSFWERPFRELSGGMKQKVNILQACMFDFDLAILDEPTASLDPGIAHYFKGLIGRLRAEGRSILFTTHVMSEVEEMADTLGLLVDGRLHLLARPTEFRDQKNAATLAEALLAYWRTSTEK